MIRKLNQYKYFIFGVDHTNSLGLARSLGEAGIRDIHAIILSTHVPVLLNNCKYVSQYDIVSTPEEGLKLLIKRYSDKTIKHFLFTSSDDIQAILDDNYNSLSIYYNWGNCGQQGSLQRWFIKENQYLLAKECGFTIPLTYEVNKGEIPQYIKYPVITKAVDSLTDGWKSLTYICQNEKELRSAYSRIPSTKVILQEYVDRVCETKFQSFIYNGQVLKSVPQCFDYEFTSTSYGNHHVYKGIENPELLDKAELMLNKIGFQGLFEIEFMKGKNGSLYFLEINFRNSGVGYFMTSCGVNLPVLYAVSVINNELTASDSGRLEKPIQTLKDWSDFQALVRGRRMGLFTWIKTRFNTADTYLLWNKRDKKPALAFAMNYILKSISHKLK